MNACWSVLLAFLPKRYRRLLRADEIAPSAAIISGLLEFFICFGVLVYRYFRFMDLRVNGVTQRAVLGTVEQAGDTGVMAFGIFFLLEYLIQFTTAALLVLSLEGILRAVTAVVNREIYPALPSVLIALLHGKLEATGTELLLGRRVPDEVLLASTGNSLEIASCRPKPWNQSTSISYADQFYVLDHEEKGPRPRRYRYFLKKWPTGSVIRSLHVYDPNEVFQKQGCTETRGSLNSFPG